MLIFLTLSIIAFNCYPLTAVMIIILALLNDMPIMMITYSNVKIHEYLVRWNMRDVLVVASLLGVPGVFSSFFLLLIGMEVPHLKMGVLQLLIFPQDEGCRKMIIYLARTDVQNFWRSHLKPISSSCRNHPIIGTLIAVYGFFMSLSGGHMQARVGLRAAKLHHKGCAKDTLLPVGALLRLKF